MKKLENLLEILDISQIDSKIFQFREYRDKLLGWNDKVNLTSIVDPEEFEAKHFVDSLMVATEKEFIESHKIIDIGTGGGFPGIPLAIAYPDKEFLLVDSLGKRLKIVRELADEISLKNVKVLHSRAEDLGRDQKYREKFDLCVSRAVAHLSVLSEYCIPMVRVGGSFISYKGPDGKEEIKDAKGAIKMLGGGIPQVISMDTKIAREDYDLDHILVVIRKDRKTPKNYPRTAGTPAKYPLK